MALALLLTGSVAAKASADHSLPVAVQVELDIPALSTIWEEAKQQRVRSELSAALADHLSKIFPFWVFETSPRKFGIRLVFRLKEEIKGEGRLRALLWYEEEIQGEHGLGILYKPNQGAILARLAQEPRLFVQIAHDRIYNEKIHRDGLRRVLMDGVPVSTLGQWRIAPSGATSVVLPLRWEPDFQRLSDSKFRLLGERPDHPDHWFDAEGSRTPARYPVRDKRGQESYPALQVYPPPQNDSELLTRYTPQHVYLTRYVPRILARMKVGRIPKPTSKPAQAPP